MPVTKEGELVQNPPVNNKFTRYGDLIMGVDDTSKARFFRVDESGNLLSKKANFAIRVDESSVADTTYVGYAEIGSLPENAVWQIRRIYEGAQTIITWADGNENFDNIWNNRISLTYS